MNKVLTYKGSTAKEVSTNAPFFKSNIQRKLSADSAKDSYEKEVDNMAYKVMRMSEPEPSSQYFSQTGSFVQRKCAACEEEEKVQRKRLSENISPIVQLSPLHRSGGYAPYHVESQINSSRGGGSIMDQSTKNFMESRFGADFSDVRIHTGSQAVQMSRELNAQAFTVGNDIYFNEGKYNPSSDNGKHLLAHELTHSLQQEGMRRKIQRIPTESGINDGRYNFSTHCGWIDWSHASPAIPLALMQQIQNASDLIAAGLPAPQVVFAPAMESKVPYIGTLLSGVTPHFSITRQLSRSEVLRVALRVWQMQSLGFEALQQWTEAFGSSSYSEEDLSSNMIAFYQAAQGLDRSRLITVCDIWDLDRSLAHIESYHFTRWGGFSPPHLPAGGLWPFTSISPAPLDGSMMTVPEATFETTTDSARYSLGGIHLLNQGGLQIVSHEGDTVDISSTSTSDSDAPRFEISPLSISSDLQFRWIIADDSDNKYLMWGDSGEVKHYGNHPSAFIRHRTRDLLRRENIRNARVLCRLIAGRNQPGSVERLYSKQINFTW